MVFDPLPLRSGTSFQFDGPSVQRDICSVKNFQSCQGVVKFNETISPSMLCSKTRIGKEYKVTGMDPVMKVFPNIGGDLFLDVIH